MLYKAVELCKIYDGKKPKALELFLKVTNISENEFFELVKNHVVEPFQMPSKNDLDRNTSNIKPKDLDNWLKKFS